MVTDWPGFTRGMLLTAVSRLEQIFTLLSTVNTEGIRGSVEVTTPR